MDFPKSKPKAIDLFCGAGGLSLGFEEFFDIDAALDWNKAAVVTHNCNLKKAAALADLAAGIPELPQVDLVMGGPPCQGFSSAGLRRPDDPRNSLVSLFAKAVAQARPKAFLFENVEGFLTAEGGARVLDLLTPLLRAGYCIHVRKVNAASYGVPQHRKRVIAIGGLGWNPSFPDPNHMAFGAPGADLAGRGLRPTPSVMDALSGLAPPTTDPPGKPQGHYYAPLAGIELERAKLLGPGDTMFDLPPELQHGSFRRRAFRRVMDGTPTEKRGGAPAGLRRLDAGQPSKAITGGARSEFLHPFEDRNLTLRECARLQTFPDSFEFTGSASEQSQMIGNAVPPRLARVLAESLAKDLAAHEESLEEGKLLSFDATVSDGCSPALKQVVVMVRQQFRPFLSETQTLLWQ